MSLLHDPIIEMVLDIDCVMPPGFDVSKTESSAREYLKDKYPKARTVSTAEVHVNLTPTSEGQEAASSHKRSVQALQFFLENEKNSIQQIVQFRAQGFSFNRMALYKSLDEYLPEIERTWNIFVKVSSPIQVTALRLRYINRILLPLPRNGNGITLTDFFTSAPRTVIPNVSLTNFLTQQSGMVAAPPNNQFHTVLFGQPVENDYAPIIFDNTAVGQLNQNPNNWEAIRNKIFELRLLKNEVFYNTLTKACLSIYQKPKEQILQSQ